MAKTSDVNDIISAGSLSFYWKVSFAKLAIQKYNTDLIGANQKTDKI